MALAIAVAMSAHEPRAAEACIMRDLSLNPAHIAFGNQFTLAGRAAVGFSGGVVSIFITAPGTTITIRYSGVALKSYADGSGWILASNHPNGDLSGLGYGEETVTVGLAANNLTSGETRLSVTRMVVLSDSGSRDPNRRDLRLYYVPAGLPQFPPMEMLTMDQVPLGSHLSFAGFGRWGSESAGFQPTSGDIRGFVAQYVSTGTSGGFSSSFYRQALTAPSDSTPLLGRGASGYSGGGVFFQEMLCGIMQYGTNGTIFQGNTGFNYFTQALIDEINQITACPADFNADGFLDFFDYDDYVNCFETGTCSDGTADFNGDGFVDFFDYADFVGAFETGC
jgi:hypothetical protein